MAWGSRIEPIRIAEVRWEVFLVGIDVGDLAEEVFRLARLRAAARRSHHAEVVQRAGDGSASASAARRRERIVVTS